MALRTIFLVLVLACCGEPVLLAKNQYMLVPRPKELIPAKGIFKITGSTKILVSMANEPVKKTANRLAETLFHAGGLQIPVEEIAGETGQVNTIGFFITADTSLGAEGYRMEVNKKM